MTRTVTDDDVETFWRDGVVCLRDVIDTDLVNAMAAPIEELLTSPTMADMTAMGDGLAAAGETVERDETTPSTGRFVSGVDHWRDHDAFRRFAAESALPAIAAALLRATKINLWEDSVLVKEPGTRERTAWHQDLSYFHVEGEQLCTTWVPLDPADADSGAMRFVRGSHRWGALYQPNLFVSQMPIPGTDGIAVPDIDSRDDVDVITFALGPGDLTVHHARTLHAAGANTSDRRRRAISVRYCGDDARYFTRAGAPMKPHHHTVTVGAPLDGPDCPVVWRATPPHS